MFYSLLHHRFIPKNFIFGGGPFICGDEYCFNDSYGSTNFLHAGTLNQVYIGHLNSNIVDT